MTFAEQRERVLAMCKPQTEEDAEALIKGQNVCDLVDGEAEDEKDS